MVAFIKRRKDFRTVASAEVVSYDVPLASIADDVGTIMLYDTTVTRGSEGDFLIMDGHIWLIDQVTPAEMQTTVTVTDIAGAFDRLLPFEAEGESIGAFLAQQLADHYRNVSDLEYRMPYLEITNLDNTEFLGPTVTDADGQPAPGCAGSFFCFSKQTEYFDPAPAATFPQHYL